MMPRGIKLTLITLASLLAIALLGFAGLVIYLKNKDFNEYKVLVQEAAHDSTGRTLTIDGDIEIHVSLNPSLSVSGVHLSNAAWSKQPNMLDVDELEVEVQLRPLLHGQLIVNRFILVKPVVRLETDNKGTGNWVFEKAADAAAQSSESTSSASLPQLDKVQIRDLLFSYHDGQTGKQWQLGLPELDGQTLFEDDQTILALQAKATFAKEAMHIQARIDSLQALAENKAASIELKVDFSDAMLTANGSIEQPFAGKGIQARLVLDSKSPARLAALADIALPKDFPLHMNLDVQDNAEGMLVTLNKATWGASDVAGDIQLQLNGKKPAIAATLKSDTLDVAAWMPAKEENKQPEKKDVKPTSAGKKEKAKVFSSEPLPLDKLNELPKVTLAWNIRRLVVPDTSSQQVDMHMQLDKGSLRIEPVTMQLAGGSLKTSIRLDAKKSSANMNLSITGRNIVAGNLSKSSGGNSDMIADGPMDLDVTLQASGQSVAALMAGLDGRIKLKMGKAKVKTSSLNLIGGDLVMTLFEKLNPFSDTLEYTDLQCGVVHFRVEKGQMLSEDGIAFETGRMNILSEGKINLQEETIDMGISTEPRDGLGLNVSNMINVVRLGGTLAEPGLSMDAVKSGMAAARVAGAFATGGLSLLGESLINRVTADSKPCETALAMP